MNKEWAEKAIANKKFAREKVEEFARNYKQNPEMIIEYLDFSSRFYQYSAANVQLIYSQNPNATFVQSYDAWKNDGASVKRGSKGIAIWVPVQSTFLKVEEKKLLPLREASKEQKEAYKKGEIEAVKKLNFSVGYVFDISQTTFPKEQYPKMFTMGEYSEKSEKIIQALTQFAEKEMGCQVVEEDLSSISLRGYYFDKKIALNKELNTSERLSTLTHEMGHALEEHNHMDGKSTAQKEYEGDCISIIIQKTAGVEISETRKRHFKNCYNQFLEELNQKFSSLPDGEKEEAINKEMQKAFDGIHGMIKKNMPVLQGYLSEPESITRSLQEQKKIKKEINQYTGQKKWGRGIS